MRKVQRGRDFYMAKCLNLWCTFLHLCEAAIFTHMLSGCMISFESFSYKMTFLNKIFQNKKNIGFVILFKGQ